MVSIGEVPLVLAAIGGMGPFPAYRVTIAGLKLCFFITGRLGSSCKASLA